MARNMRVWIASLRPALRLWPVVLLAVVLAACGGVPGTVATPTPELPVEDFTPAPAGETPAAGAPRLRVTNGGVIPVEDLVIIFPEDRVEFGDVPVGATTEYKDVPHGVYRYAAYELVVDGQPIQQLVIDWVGEEPVPGQEFTWVIDVDPGRSGYDIVHLVQATVDR